MVEHKRLLRQQAGQLDRCRQLLGVEEQVVGEPKLVEVLETANKRLAQQKPRVGLVLNNMPHARKFFVRGERRQIVSHPVAP